MYAIGSLKFFLSMVCLASGVCVIKEIFVCQLRRGGKFIDKLKLLYRFLTIILPALLSVGS